MAYEIVFKSRFEIKLVELLKYLENEWGKKVADELLIKIDKRISSLQQHPFIGKLTSIKNTRGIHITKHNRLYYRVSGNKVIILNLYDTRTKDYS